MVSVDHEAVSLRTLISFVYLPYCIYSAYLYRIAKQRLRPRGTYNVRAWGIVFWMSKCSRTARDKPLKAGQTNR